MKWNIYGQKETGGLPMRMDHKSFPLSARAVCGSILWPRPIIICILYSIDKEETLFVSMTRNSKKDGVLSGLPMTYIILISDSYGTGITI